MFKSEFHRIIDRDLPGHQNGMNSFLQYWWRGQIPERNPFACNGASLRGASLCWVLFRADNVLRRKTSTGKYERRINYSCNLETNGMCQKQHGLTARSTTSATWKSIYGSYSESLCSVVTTTRAHGPKPLCCQGFHGFIKKSPSYAACL